MSSISNPVGSIFSKLELECGLEKENNLLKEENKLLKSKLQELEKKEIEKTKYNPDIQTVVLYLHGDGVYMHCEEWQEKQFTFEKKEKGREAWGNGIKFNSIAGMHTQLMRLGFKFFHEAKYINNLPVEVWVKGM